MTWFSKKRTSSDRKWQAEDEPFVADDSIVARVAALMKMWNDAAGNNAMMHTTERDICIAAGLVDFHQLVSSQVPVDVLLQRPWKMLAAVALRAAQNGDHVLVGSIFGFTHMWNTLIAPQLGPADWVDVPMSASPAVIEAAIASVALNSLRQLSAQHIIFSNATGSIPSSGKTISNRSLLLIVLLCLSILV